MDTNFANRNSESKTKSHVKKNYELEAVLRSRNLKIFRICKQPRLNWKYEKFKWLAESEHHIFVDRKNISKQDQEIRKFNLPRHQKKERWGINHDKTNATYETTDARTATEEPPWNGQ